MQEYFKFLGRKVKDRVTGFTGTVTTVGFDLYGCVMGIVTQDHNLKDGEQKLGDNHWFDLKRLEVLDDKPVMNLPAFAVHTPATVAGGDVRKPVR